MESIEAGTSLLLIDEDTSATNFMIRDELMQRVIHRDMEPITPFIERIRELYDSIWNFHSDRSRKFGRVFPHRGYVLYRWTAMCRKTLQQYAKKEAESFPMISVPEQDGCYSGFRQMSPSRTRRLRDNDRIKMKTLWGVKAVMINKETIDLQLCRADHGQRAGNCPGILHAVCAEAHHGWEKESAPDCG